MAESIDALLVRYLGLLHEYTELRGQLASRQASMFTHLARANFAAERGFRYGPDHFDGRMQAVVRLVVGDARGDGDAAAAELVPSYTVVRPEKKKVKPDEVDDADKADKQEQDAEQEATNATEVKKTPKHKAKTAAKPQATRDPLQWFGVLTPMALRQAQAEAIAAVDTIIPRLASLSAEMAAVEIEVRRARKKLARSLKQEQSKDATETAAFSV